MKVKDYLATFGMAKSFARPNLYSVELFPPSGLEISNTILEQISANCKSAELPGKSIDAQQHISGGYLATQMPFNTTYMPIPLTFRCSGDLREKTFFEEWHKLIYNETTNTLGWYEDFVGAVTIAQLSRNGKILKKYNLSEVWPGAVNSVPVSYDSTDSISEVTVSLYYRQYRPVE